MDALQSYVAGLTGIAVADQILMCEGVPLDPAKPLSAYKLPSVRHALRCLPGRDPSASAANPVVDAF